MDGKGFVKLLVGLLLIIIGLWVYLSPWINGFFGRQFLIMIKLILGNIPGLVILIGLVIFLLGIGDLKG